MRGRMEPMFLFTPSFFAYGPPLLPFKRNFVHGQFHQVDAAPCSAPSFRTPEDRELYWRRILALIPDYDRQPTAAFAAATDVDQLACVSAIAVEHRITQGFPKREFNESSFSANTARCCDQSHKPIHQREICRFALAPSVHLQRCIREAKFGEHRLQRFETANQISLQHLSGVILRA